MNKELGSAITWAGGIIVLALGATFARQWGYIDADTVTRIVVGTNGLLIAWYGNRMPKAFVPSAGARKAARVGGWSMVLSGLIYAALWAFAPIQIAVIGGCAAVIAGIAITAGYCLSLRAKAKAA
ncbi:ammonium transporter [Sphingomonas sp. AOB5]|uniref:ammonium transporter n=1 Tax=Sphingomonas sp. AOB5 TaxID=3034017 RepID=UPI0023F89EAE|nr:ammonium transporter [Sphingomonas sp. AOB5]MDF7777393.1 ammonium transporter [Sphingomonas sp. AOB5]